MVAAQPSGAAQDKNLQQNLIMVLFKIMIWKYDDVYKKADRMYADS